ncbi:hypothetical protein COU37_05560 [Candidatus Micrarchaeota archaeon CG10_big_fil_rev_8_21_14_0_10_45_29]|nr:MAG: hypothetical protein COU37_05560 [Candidatus Micrarchaeota archaeon CG10_big_fil_rev_8_21_14_0_10_45_29]
MKLNFCIFAIFILPSLLFAASLELVSPTAGVGVENSANFMVSLISNQTSVQLACGLYIDGALTSATSIYDEDGIFTFREVNLTSLTNGSHKWMAICNSTLSEFPLEVISPETLITKGKFATVTLISPQNNTETTNRDITFSFQYEENDFGKETAECYFYANNDKRLGPLMLPSGEVGSININDIFLGEYNWSVKCDGIRSGTHRLLILKEQPAPAQNTTTPGENEPKQEKNVEDFSLALFAAGALILIALAIYAFFIKPKPGGKPPENGGFGEENLQQNGGEVGEKIDSIAEFEKTNDIKKIIEDEPRQAHSDEQDEKERKKLTKKKKSKK